MAKKNRRHVTGFTIDPDGSEIFDDAILLEKDAHGYRAMISIADVASVVDVDSSLDETAYKKAFTRYYETSTDPMLPFDLSKQSLSLMPQKHRPALSFIIAMTLDGQIHDVQIERTMYFCNMNYTYYDVSMSLQDPKHRRHEKWLMYYQFARMLARMRQKSGSCVHFDMLEEAAQHGEDTEPLLFHEYSSELIVHEFMLLANVAVTELLKRAGVPILFRNHRPRSDDDVIHALFREYCTSHDLTPQDRQEIVRVIKSDIRYAAYESECVGHFGLRVPAYAHWTSPIRRYADIVNHRQLLAWLDGKPLPYSIGALEEKAAHLNSEAARLCAA